MRLVAAMNLCRFIVQGWFCYIGSNSKISTAHFPSLLDRYGTAADRVRQVDSPCGQAAYRDEAAAKGSPDDDRAPVAG